MSAPLPPFAPAWVLALEADTLEAHVAGAMEAADRELAAGGPFLIRPWVSHTIHSPVITTM